MFWQIVYRKLTSLSKQNEHWINQSRTPFSKCTIIPNVDLFATRFNHKLPLYVSPVPDDQALAIDALNMNWNLFHAYAFPRTILIPPVLAKIRQSRCRIVLITPLWPQRPWFSEVLELLVSAPIRLPLFPKLLTQAKGKFQHQIFHYSTFTLGSYQAINQRFCLKIKTNINSESR